MDLTDPKQETRQAQLDYYSALSLIQFHNLQHKQNEEAQLHPPEEYNYGQLCETLAAIHPDVSFNFVDPGQGHGILATVKPGIEGPLIEKIGFVNSNTPYLSTTLTHGDEIDVFLRADGLGILKEDNWYEFFEHELDLEKVRRECENDEDAISDYVQDHFREEISGQMEDPFFDPWEANEDCNLHFETGSRDELDRLMKLFILTEPEIETHDGEEVRLYAATEDDDPYLEDHACYWSKRLSQLIEIAVSENRPVGWTWEYNDGPIYRRSGYSHSAESLTWVISEILEQAPAREKMAARRELRLYLEAHGYDLARLDAVSERRSAV